jgi:hypothetical protein
LQASRRLRQPSSGWQVVWGFGAAVVIGLYTKDYFENREKY